MDQNEYMTTRVDGQINWMEGKSKNAKTKYYILKSLQIIFAALVPFIAGYTDQGFWIKVTEGLLGVAIVIIIGIQDLFRFRENWLNYRTCIEKLNQEKFLFQTLATPYDGAEPFKIFVPRIESILGAENENWSKVQPKPNEEK